MPTDQQHFSHGYEGKKARPKAPRRKAPPRNRLAEHQGHVPQPGVPSEPPPNRIAEHEGRLPQPGVPSSPRNSTKAERRAAARRRRAAAAAKHLAVPDIDAEGKRAAASVRRFLREHPAYVKAQDEKETGGLSPSDVGDAVSSALEVLKRQDPSSSITRKATAEEAKNLVDVAKESLTAGRQARGIVKAPSGKELDAIGAITAPVGIAETAPAEIAAKTASTKAALKNAALAARGAKVGEETVGGSRIARAIGARPVEAADSAANRAAVKAAKEGGSGVRKAVSAARRGSRGRAAAREVTGTATRREAAHAVGAPGIAAKATGAQVLPVVRGHEKAIAENPGKTLETTARAIPGLVTAPVGQAAALGVSAGRAASEGAHALGIPGARGYSGSEITAPLVGVAKEQVDFARQVARIATASDSAEVQKAVEDELGLLLPVMLGLGGKAAADKLPVTKGRITEAVRKVVDQVRSTYGGSHGDHRGRAPRVFEKSGQRKRESIRAANAKARVSREVGDRTREIRKEAGKAKGSEVLRRGVTKRGRVVRRKGDLTIRSGDVVNFAVRHALPLDKPAQALAEVKRIGATLREPTKSGRPDLISTRDVIGFLEKNPEVLADRHLAAAVAAYRDQAAHARKTRGISPDHSERARYMATAVSRDIAIDSERFPRSIRDEVRADPTPGRPAKDVLRREARSDRSLARRQNRKAATREARGRAIAAELKVRERAEPGWAARNAAVAAKGTRLTNQARLYRDAAAKATELADRKGRAAAEGDDGLTEEFTREVADRLAAEGLPDPEYTSTGVGREAPTVGATGAQLTRFPGRSKRRSGAAERYGLVREDLPSLLRESIARPVSRREAYKAMRSFLEENEYRHGGAAEFTSDQARDLFDSGVIDRDHWVLIDRGLYERALDPEERAAALQMAIDEDKDAALEPGRRYKIVRRTAAEEFMGQLGEAVLPRLAAINRVTSYLILGTSPAWAAAQIVAEYSQAAAAQPRLLNPLYLRKTIAAYRSMPEEKRWAFDSWAGITKGEPRGAGETRLDKRTGDLSTAHDAWSALDRTPLGRLIRGIPHALASIDRIKGGHLRAAVVVSKMDRDLNSRLPVFLRGVRGLYDELGKASEEMKGKPLAQQVSYLADHPEAARRYQGYVDDVMGNWSALTRNEQLASRIVIFYPFIRMATRWTFYAFPHRHPIKAALLTYLGQQNSVELEKLLHGSPSFFADWANIPLHLGHGRTELIPLSRVAPATGLASQLLGEGGKNAAGSALGSLQPGLAAAVVALTGVDTYSGEQHPGRGAAAVAQLLDLSPLTRAADEELTPGDRETTDQALPVLGPLFGSTERQTALDALFDKLGEKHTASRLARQLAVPVLPKSLSHERDLLKLQQALDAITANSSTARKELGEREADAAVGLDEAGHRRVERSTYKQVTRMKVAYERGQESLDKLLSKYGIEAEPFDSSIYSVANYGTAPQTGPAAGTLGGHRVRDAEGPSSSSVPAAGTIGGRKVTTTRRRRPTATNSPGRLPEAGTLGGVKVR